MTVLTSMRISLNFEGVTNGIGRYPFAKIPIADVYSAAGLLIPCIVQYSYLALFLNTAVNLWNSDVNLVNLHKVI